MLTNLHVKNLALIEEAEVDFGPGLNILTGETGAGKSLLLGSINLALGKKMTKDMVREGADSCLVELVFRVDDEDTIESLRELEIETEDGQLILTRKLQNGRSISRINGETTTAARIREAAALLLDIHGQHEHQSLLYPDQQLHILDSYGKEELTDALEAVSLAYGNYKRVKNELKQYEMNADERLREISFLEYEIQEIEAAALLPGEEEELERQHRKMSNSRKIADGLQEAHALTGNDGGAGERVGMAIRAMAGLSDYDDALADAEKLLTDIEDLLNSFNQDVSGYLADFSFSEAEFYELEQRLDVIRTIKKKYGRTEEDVADNLFKKQEELKRLRNYEVRKAELEKELSALSDALEKSSQDLSASRKKLAAKLEKNIETELGEMNFPYVRFEIAFEKNAAYAANGYDSIDFRISTNEGEPVLPLAKVASGGELSRIMLAIKTLLADKDRVETLLFDEIDTGISGRTAQKISEKMAKIGKSRQVLCITHLAQIAAMADRHYVIEKSSSEGETTSGIRLLSADEQTMELARILGGARITGAVMENAREMRELALQIKQ